MQDRFTECHTLRWFFPAEMKYFLENNGFDLVELFPGTQAGKPANDSTWYLTSVANPR